LFDKVAVTFVKLQFMYSNITSDHVRSELELTHRLTFKVIHVLFYRYISLYLNAIWSY